MVHSGCLTCLVAVDAVVVMAVVVLWVVCVGDGGWGMGGGGGAWGGGWGSGFRGLDRRSTAPVVHVGIHDASHTGGGGAGAGAGMISPTATAPMLHAVAPSAPAHAHAHGRAVGMGSVTAGAAAAAAALPVEAVLRKPSRKLAMRRMLKAIDVTVFLGRKHCEDFLGVFRPQVGCAVGVCVCCVSECALGQGGVCGVGGIRAPVGVLVGTVRTPCGGSWARRLPRLCSWL
jgi:hypothetical protein